MNLKKKVKGFFTLTRKSEGFTLVELIVVIAILAILAGVAVPAYNGYIKKADRSADDALLNEINTAFASACMANGESNFNRTDSPVINLTDKTIDAEPLTTGNAGINESFKKFFEGEGQAFKVFEGVFYDPALGMFGVDEVLAFTFGDKLINLSSKDVTILRGDNAFSNRGPEALLSDVGVLQTYLAGGFVGEEILDDIGSSDEFYFAMGSYLGMKREEYADDNAYKAAIGTEVERLGATNPNIATNALIMYSASHAANASQAQIDRLFTGTVTGNIAVMKKDENGNTVRDNEATMANAALAYGMYTAYVQRNNLDPTTQGNDFVNIVTSDGFEDYIKDENGKADLQAYMSAMNMISDNAGNPEITSDILSSGIVGNTDLEALMQQVMGK